MKRSKHYLVGLSLVLMATLSLPATVANAQSDTTTNANISALLETLQSLMKQVEDLQKQLAEVRGEIRTELKDGLREGMTDEDIKKIQELLATDPTIYPRGLVTGYYGPLTRDAVLRFQARHELRTTGEVDAETKALILEYFKERTNGRIPPGLLRAPGIDKKIKLRLRTDGERYELNCEDKRGAGFLCREKYDDHDDDEDEENHEDEDTEKTDEEVEDAIEDAKNAIEDLENSIELAEAGDNRDEAEEELAKAEELLEEAEEAYEDGDNNEAYEKAQEAEETAEEAHDDLDHTH